SLLCPPAEEGKNHTLIFKWIFDEKNTDIKISVERKEYAIAMCFYPNTCTDYYDDEFKTKYMFDRYRNRSTIEVQIFKTSRDEESFWYIVQNTVVFKCAVKIYSRAPTVSCNQFVSDDGLYISCSASQIYPMAKCVIEIVSLKSAKIFINTTMMCENNRLVGRPTYY
ncbi:unnamed protein product, partial [Lymnaea stagnalis]